MSCEFLLNLVGKYHSVRYGPLKRSALIKTAFRKRILNAYLLLIDDSTQVKAFKTGGAIYLYINNKVQDFHILVNGHQVETALEMLRSVRQFRPGFDGSQLLQICQDHSQFYIDNESADKLLWEPSPLHAAQIEDNPHWAAILTKRKELMYKYVQPEHIEYYEKCQNTFELHNQDGEEAVKAYQEKYHTMNSLAEEEITPIDDDDFIRLFFLDALTSREVTGDDTVRDTRIDLQLDQLHLMGSKNSAHGGYSSNIKTEGRDTKSSLHVVSTMEAIELANMAHRTAALPMRPVSINAKDELVKAEKDGSFKKEKAFNNVDAAIDKLCAALLPNGTDKYRMRIGSGFCMGLTQNGGTLGELARVVLGTATGKGRLMDEELEELEVYGTDYKGFEYRKDPYITLITMCNLALEAGGGAMSSAGNEQVAIRRLRAYLLECIFFADYRVGGGNLVFKMDFSTTPSGYRDTLQLNTKDQFMMAMRAQFEHDRINKCWSPANAGKVSCGLRNGDDGIGIRTDYVEGVLKTLSEIRPQIFGVEKKGTLVSRFGEDLENQGVSFCKQNFTLESVQGEQEARVVPRRTHENLVKIFRGNTSDVHPAKLAQGCRSKVGNALRWPHAQEFLKEFHHFLVENYKDDMGPHYRPENKLEAEGRPETFLDYDPGQGTDLPTEEEAFEQITKPDPVTIMQMRHNYHRILRYRIPLKY